MTNNQLDRFLAKVSLLPNGCWEWTATRTGGGYGWFMVSWTPRHVAVAHRASYEHFVGDIPSRLEIDHLCRNRACVNPTHLEPVTRKENIRRGMHCKASPHWQEYSPEHREAIAASKRGRKRAPFSAEWRSRLAATSRGRTHSDETRALMSAHMKGLKRSAEGCANIKAAAAVRSAKLVQARTHCAHGHAYDEKNTRLAVGRKGLTHRECRACDAAYQAAKRAARRNAEQAA